MNELETKPDFVCPDCGKEVFANLLAKAKAISRMNFTISPKDGEFLGLKHVGGIMVEMEKFLKLLSKDAGMKATVTIETITSTDGAVSIDMLIGRTPFSEGER